MASRQIRCLLHIGKLIIIGVGFVIIAGVLLGMLILTFSPNQ